MRIGHGYDVHRFEKGRDLYLGGIKIDYEYGLLGHSDADVVIHALMDSIIGALAMGDIGTLFPDNDDSYKNIDSKLLLAKVAKLLCDFYLVNADITIIAQQPKLKDYIPKMRQTIAEILGAKDDDISIKATTEEGLGFTGRKEGIACHAVCLLDNKK